MDLESDFIFDTICDAVFPTLDDLEPEEIKNGFAVECIMDDFFLHSDLANRVLEAYKLNENKKTH